LLAQQQNKLLTEGNVVFCEVTAQEEKDNSRIVIKKIFDIEKILANVRIITKIFIKNQEGLHFLLPKIQREAKDLLLELQLYVEFEDGSVISFSANKKMYISEKDLELLQKHNDFRVEIH
jgi:hypothetical protein